jgi:hypothetical protein
MEKEQSLTYQNRIGFSFYLLLFCAIACSFSFIFVKQAHASCPPEMASLWKLEEGSGGTFFYDEIGSNHGALDGEPLTQVDGKVGYGQQFSNGDIVIDPNQDMNWAITDDFAIEFWMRSGGSGEDPEVIVGRRSSIQGNRSQLWVGIEGNLPKFYVRFTNGASFSLYGVPIDDGQWHHIVAVHESLSEEVSQFRFYVDGVQRAIRNQTLGERTLELSTEEITLGSLDGDYYYQGMLDEVAIYRGFPDVERIQLHYNNGLAGRGYCDAGQPIGEVTITSTPPTTIALGAAYSYQVTATGEPTSFMLDQAPQGMSISREGMIIWTPQELGSFDVQVTAANDQSSDMQTFVVEVTTHHDPQPDDPDEGITDGPGDTPAPPNIEDPSAPDVGDRPGETTAPPQGEDPSAPAPRPGDPGEGTTESPGETPAQPDEGEGPATPGPPQPDPGDGVADRPGDAPAPPQEGDPESDTGSSPDESVTSGSGSGGGCTLGHETTMGLEWLILLMGILFIRVGHADPRNRTRKLQ